MSSFFDLPFEEPASAEAARGKDEPMAATPLPPEPDARRILTVSQLTARIRTLLEEQFFEVWVEGELSNC